MIFVDSEAADRAVISAFKHDSSKVRRAAAQAAGESLMASALPGLRRLVRAGDSELRKAAEDAILRLVRFGVVGR